MPRFPQLTTVKTMAATTSSNPPRESSRFCTAFGEMSPATLRGLGLPQAAPGPLLRPCPRAGLPFRPRAGLSVRSRPGPRPGGGPSRAVTLLPEDAEQLPAAGEQPGLPRPDLGERPVQPPELSRRGSFERQGAARATVPALGEEQIAIRTPHLSPGKG
nr:hypothetical protein GCM10020093_066120 [Planobispora longispora]